VIFTCLRAALAFTAFVDSITGTVAGVETVCDILECFGVDTREISSKLEASKKKEKD
jgi:hypothetical protein